MTDPASYPVIKPLIALLPGCVGAAIALRFNTTDSRAIDRVFAFAAGASLAHYGGGALAQWYGLDGLLADSTKLAVGLFGLALVASVMAEIPALIAAARRRFLGDPTQ